MTAARPPMLLYADKVSGRSHRARLMLSLLGLPYRVVEKSLARREHKQPDYLAIHPLGLLPALDDDGTVLTDSMSILVYLALKYDPARTWLPADPLRAAEVARWLGFATGPGEFGPADARGVTLFGAKHDPGPCFDIVARHFPRMETLLDGRAFLAGEAPTIADVANYTYTWLAPEGGVSLEPYPRIRAWLARVEALPGFTPMHASPVGLRAG